MTNETTEDVARDTVVERLRKRVQQSPASAAFYVLTRDSRWHAITWAAYANRVERAALALSASGIVRGDRVAICARASLEWEVAQMASLRLGASVVGLDTAYADDLLAKLVAQLNIAVFIAQDLATLARIPDGLRDQFKLVLTIENGGSGQSTAHSLAELEALAVNVPALGAPPHPDDEALVVFSSGTTGSPKPVSYCHGQLSLALDAILDAFSDIPEGSTLVSWLPLANLFQRMINFSAVTRGASTYLIEDPRTVMAHVRTASPTIFIGVPRFFEKVYAAVNERIEGRRIPARIARWAVRAGRRRTQALRNGRRPALVNRWAWPMADRLVLRKIRATFGINVRYFVSGSAPMPYWLLEWFDAIGLPVLEAYGISENIVPIAINRYGARKLGTVGKSLPAQEVELAADGEILVRGSGIALPDSATRASFANWQVPRLLATGDVGEFDSDGFLRLTGRKADVFKSSTGKWVAPAEIEGRLRRLPHVEHAIALGAGRKAVVALVGVAGTYLRSLSAEAHAKGSAGAPSSASDGMLHQQLRRDVARALADLSDYQQPAALLVVGADAFSVAGGELTTNMKLRRARIEARFARAIDRTYLAIEEVPASRGARVVSIVIDTGDPAS